jgi:glycosyltransferase involved in cell wall biosynthesis
MAPWQLIIISVFAVVLLSQIIYFLYFFSRLAFYKPAEISAQAKLPLSVIICARDEAQNLTKYLPGVLVQQYPSYQTLVINDVSYDETALLLEGLKKEFPHLDFINLNQEAKFIAGKKYPLSVGIKSAHYNHVALTDADCVPASEDWLHHINEIFSQGKEIVLGYSGYFAYKGWLNKIIRFETVHTAMQYFGYALAGQPYMGVGRNLAYNKQLFFKEKGFSKHSNIPSGDDDLFINAVATSQNTGIMLHPNSFVWSEPKKTWTSWAKQKQRHYSTSKFYKPKFKWLLGWYSASHFLFYALLPFIFIILGWPFALGAWLLRLIIQWIVFGNSCKVLGEKNLAGYYPFFDLFLLGYYLFFVRSLFKKPKNAWTY